MTEQRLVHIVYFNDHEYVALYLNGKKVAEGHSLDPSDILCVLRVPHWSSEVNDWDAEFMPPDSLVDLLTNNEHETEKHY